VIPVQEDTASWRYPSYSLGHGDWIWG